MKRLAKNTYRLKRFIRDDIWKLELEELSKARARFIKYLKVMMITIKTFSSEKIGFQAVALSFFSTMSVIPFVAIVFAITGGFGLADKLKEFLYDYFNNSQQIIDLTLAPGGLSQHHDRFFSGKIRQGKALRRSADTMDVAAAQHADRFRMPRVTDKNHCIAA